MGDAIDRGRDTIELYDWLEQLRREASERGQHVFTLLGNHEIANARGDWRFARLDFPTFGNDLKKRWEMISTGKIGTYWRENYVAALRLPLVPIAGKINGPMPDNGRLLRTAALAFVHGGIPPDYPDEYLLPFPTRMNELAKSLLGKLQSAARDGELIASPYRLLPLPHGITPAEQALIKDPGPFWYRDWVTGSRSVICSEIKDVLSKIGARRVIVGHTHVPTVKDKCGGRLIATDTGLSEALSIKYTLTVESKQPPEWMEEEVISAIDESGNERKIKRFETRLTAK